MKNLKYILDLNSDKTLADTNNFYGFLYVEFLVFNYDGKGGAIVRNEDGKTSCVDVSVVELVLDSPYYTEYTHELPPIHYTNVTDIDIYESKFLPHLYETIRDHSESEVWANVKGFYVEDFESIILELEGPNHSTGYVRVTPKIELEDLIEIVNAKNK